MSADFWAGYLSGAAGILIGNPLDIIKTRLQAGSSAVTAPVPETTATTGFRPVTFQGAFDSARTLVRGSAAPILGYGALNALLFVTYNRTLEALDDNPLLPKKLFNTWIAGAAGGLTTFVVSAPTELIKCRAQVSSGSVSSWSVARDVWKHEGIRGFYHGGGVTSARDAIGYGFYFYSYEWSKQTLTSPTDTDHQTAFKILLCGGLAGIATWVSVFPLDVIKTRVQTQLLHHHTLPHSTEHSTLLQPSTLAHSDGEVQASRRLNSIAIAKQAYRNEGTGVFFRGLGVCSVRAFIVNAVQWAMYEWMMQLLRKT
ncbi:mitochondrial carrier [Delitschia confertaspora ATCC 74209]|uniref:Mitochondrial carrier n=1 Tax=Delitschia confertaspora ATCC 74209 TaxID=1513339 RepID=A0A9P4MUP9_9PLEO|nr:mitochondrial carrier [Delitschia confertaspora ATCC 74209]